MGPEGTFQGDEDVHVERGVWLTQLRAFVKAHGMLRLSSVRFIIGTFLPKNKTTCLTQIPNSS